jgi:hypothetical protein
MSMAFPPRVKNWSGYHLSSEGAVGGPTCNFHLQNKIKKINKIHSPTILIHKYFYAYFIYIDEQFFVLTINFFIQYITLFPLHLGFLVQEPFSYSPTATERMHKFCFLHFFQSIRVYALLPVLRSRSHKGPQNLVGAGAVARSISGSDGSGSDNGIYHG